MNDILNLFRLNTLHQHTVCSWLWLNHSYGPKDMVSIVSFLFPVNSIHLDNQFRNPIQEMDNTFLPHKAYNHYFRNHQF